MKNSSAPPTCLACTDQLVATLQSMKGEIFMVLLLRWFLYALAVMLVGWLIPGITVSNIVSALIICVIMALINIFIRPLVTFITLPINLLTLGLFGVIINALLFLLAGYFAPGVEIDGFLSALLGSLLLSLIGLGIDSITKRV